MPTMASRVPFTYAAACQALREGGHASVRPDIVEGLLRGMAQDGRDMEGGRGNLHLRKASPRARVSFAFSAPGPWSKRPQSCAGRAPNAFWRI